MRQRIKIVIYILVINCLSYAQQFGRGVLLEDSLYVNSPVAAPLMRGDYNDVPSKYSLKEFAPTPGYQGASSTCAAWSTAYAARTMLEAIRHDWPQSRIDSNAFSPSFIYNQIRAGKGCNRGTSLIDALDVLKNKGCEKLTDFGNDCSREVTKTDDEKAAVYRIIEYREVAGPNSENKTMFVRKSIANAHPVVIAMNCPESFINATEEWIPDSSDYKSKWMNGHGITVVGYDNNKFNGAFELINSWGTNWGKHGFTWIRYSDFEKFCKFAFEVLDKTETASNEPDLSGSLKFAKSDGSAMNAVCEEGDFIMMKSFPPGTLFELKISNSEPAYIYALGSDESCKITKIFPFNERMVAYLPYKENNIAIPDEDHFNMIDEKPGPTYYCFLYAKKSLDIDSIIKKIESGRGKFKERLAEALSGIRVESSDIKFFDGNEIKFSAKSSGKIVVPILVEIPKE